LAGKEASQAQAIWEARQEPNRQAKGAKRATSSAKPSGSGTQQEVEIASTILIPRTGKMAVDLKQAVQDMSELHRLPESVPLISVRIQPNAKYLGVYDARKVPPGIRIKSGAPQPRYTLSHEHGHRVDHFVFGNGTVMGSASHPALQEWRDVIDNDKLVGELALIGSREPRLRGYILDYLLTPPELFARSYAQWVLTESRSSRTNAEIVELYEQEKRSGLMSHWGESEFRPIAAAIRSAFQKVGLLK
jgi:hypothetical protein